MSRVLLALLPALAAAAVLPGDLDSCNPDKLTVYRMVLHTYWTREKFPKHYPDWRPPAQWSRVYGVSHNSSHVLFRLGRRVSAAVRLFAESGRADALGGGGGGGGGAGALDAFSAPPVPAGAGRTDATFFVDGNHSRVSLMARMVPSPDWFIGIDSFDLCVDGNWLDSITIEVDPIDAGTDNGFTFTAPDWPTAPQGVAYRITARYPAHPAGSFFYPHLRRLPPIATVQFIKLREYELSEVFHRASDERRYDVLQLERLAHTRDQPADGNRALSLADEAERAEQPLTPSAYDYYSLSTGNLSTTEQPRSANEIPTPAGVAGVAGAAGAERSALRSLARRYRARRRRKMYPDNADPAQRRKRKRARLLDCRVSAWGEWSACRGEGGCVGSALRTRRVLRRARPGGAPCPPTAQSRWCAANCTQTTHDDEDWHNNLT